MFSLKNLARKGLSKLLSKLEHGWVIKSHTKNIWGDWWISNYMTQFYVYAITYLS